MIKIPCEQINITNHENNNTIYDICLNIRVTDIQKPHDLQIIYLAKFINDSSYFNHKEIHLTPTEYIIHKTHTNKQTYSGITQIQCIACQTNKSINNTTLQNLTCLLEQRTKFKQISQAFHHFIKEIINKTKRNIPTTKTINFQEIWQKYKPEKSIRRNTLLNIDLENFKSF
jgi:hypothetical protein